MATTSALELESRAYINGSFTASIEQPPTTISVRSPSTGAIVGHVEAAGPLDVDAAVSAAAAAFKGPWSTFTGAQRAACLAKFADLFEAILPRVAEVESLSMGTPISAQAGRLAPNAVGIFRYYSGQAFGALQGESWPVDDDEGAYRVIHTSKPSMNRENNTQTRSFNTSPSVSAPSSQPGTQPLPYSHIKSLQALRQETRLFSKPRRKRR